MQTFCSAHIYGKSHENISFAKLTLDHLDNHKNQPQHPVNGEVVVVVFPQAPFRVTNVPGQASAGIIQLRNCTMAFLRTALGDLVTPFVLESCLIIHVLLNLQVHTWGMSLASSGKFV